MKHTFTATGANAPQQLNTDPADVHACLLAWGGTGAVVLQQKVDPTKADGDATAYVDVETFTINADPFRVGITEKIPAGTYRFNATTVTSAFTVALALA